MKAALTRFSFDNVALPIALFTLPRFTDQSVKSNRSDDKTAHHNELIECLNLKHIKAIADRSNDQTANNHRRNASFTPEKARAPDDGRGDGISFETLSSGWLRCPQSCRGEHTSETGTKA